MTRADYLSLEYGEILKVWNKSVWEYFVFSCRDSDHKGEDIIVMVAGSLIGAEGVHNDGYQNVSYEISHRTMSSERAWYNEQKTV